MAIRQVVLAKEQKHNSSGSKRSAEFKKYPFEEQPASYTRPFDEKIIRCLQSNVTFDFVNEYEFIERDANSKFRGYIEAKETDEEKYVLNGIRLFDID